MTDVFNGRSMSEGYKFISGGAAHTFTFNFDADKVIFYNLTDWKATAGTFPVSTWFKDQTTAGYVYQNVVIDSSAGASFNYLYANANGFTTANTTGGVATSYATITGVSAADPCVVTAVAHGYQSNQVVRITDLGSEMPTARGMAQLNNNRYRITVLTANTFSLKDVTSDEAINSTAYTAYVAGGRATLETHVLLPNNPAAAAYTANAFEYNAVEYKLTAGTAVMATSGDIFRIEVYKYGDMTDLGSFV